MSLQSKARPARTGVRRVSKNPGETNCSSVAGVVSSGAGGRPSTIMKTWRPSPSMGSPSEKPLPEPGEGAAVEGREPGLRAHGLERGEEVGGI